MKIILSGNHIRYRLDAEDIIRLKENEKVEEHTWIGANNLHFCLRSRSNISLPAIKLEGTGVHLSIPTPMLENLTETDENGFDFEVSNPDGSMLKIQVEKNQTLSAEVDRSAFDKPNAF